MLIQRLINNHPLNTAIPMQAKRESASVTIILICFFVGFNTCHFFVDMPAPHLNAVDGWAPGAHRKPLANAEALRRRPYCGCTLAGGTIS